MLQVDSAGAWRRGRTSVASAEQLKMLDNCVVRDIRCNRTIGPRKGVKKASPLIWHSVGAVQVGFIEPFNLRGVSTRIVRGAEELLH